MVELFIMEYLTVLYMIMAFLFMDSRYSRRRTLFIVSCVTILLMAAVVALYRAADMDAAFWIYAITIHIPLILLLFTLSRFRGWRLIFQQLSVVLFCTLIHHISGLIYYLSGSRFWVLVLSCAVLSTWVIWFLVRFLRPLFFQILLELNRGWWLICLVMATYYIIAVYLIPGYAGFDPRSTIIKPAIGLLMLGVYFILMFLFTSIKNEMEARHNAQMSALQLSALQSRMEAVKAAEDAIRTERHDLRHRLQAVAELVSRGDKDAALDFLDAAQKRLVEQKELRWCRPPVLDAVFSSYFDQAQNQGISVDAKISLSDTLSVNEGELAIVLANALENAIHANLDLPQDQRQIRCKIAGTPSIILEISNPCAGNISFDDSGLPMAKKEGHGLGVQSISAFCRKNGAVCQFDQTDGWFRLRLVL
ncbi:sensor histidine kinase [Pseudoflavonifractor phocaeensis]|uniref:sensor histidine kinase n=1 Tax=Pseudoflavonifractor phocaeensis TaxID=1870988 RepID=UPI001957119B|nr:ATP-binding protein [Pseudoflavonifractor phocaeensis]MBM6925961.1 GHKL domain-containing protein [Pseudoflavonifractor phocaeensis]